MVSTLSILAMIVTFCISVFFPIGLAIYFRRKKGIAIKAVLVGALMFFLFQGILRIPALTYIQTQTTWYSSYVTEHTILTVIMIAASAGLFETVGRYIGLRFLLKGKLSRMNGIAYGIGHGGIEAILLVGISYVGNIVYSILINTGRVNGVFYSQLISTSPSLFLVSGLERVFAILFHIAAALLVTYGIMNHKKGYIFLCFLFHTIFDAVAVLLQVNNIPIWGVEIWVAFIGILSLVYIVKSKNRFNKTEHETL